MRKDFKYSRFEYYIHKRESSSCQSSRLRLSPMLTRIRICNIHPGLENRCTALKYPASYRQKTLCIDNILLSDNLVILGHFHLPCDITSGLYKRRKKTHKQTLTKFAQTDSQTELLSFTRENMFFWPNSD